MNVYSWNGILTVQITDKNYKKIREETQQYQQRKTKSNGKFNTYQGPIPLEFIGEK